MSEKTSEITLEIANDILKSDPPGPEALAAAEAVRGVENARAVYFGTSRRGLEIEIPYAGPGTSARTVDAPGLEALAVLVAAGEGRAFVRDEIGVYVRGSLDGSDALARKLLDRRESDANAPPLAPPAGSAAPGGRRRRGARATERAERAAARALRERDIERETYEASRREAEAAPALIDALAAELRALGYGASAEGPYLRVSESPALRSPSVRVNASGAYYTWDSYYARKPATIAARLDRFLRSVDRPPLSPGFASAADLTKAADGLRLASVEAGRGPGVTAGARRDSLLARSDAYADAAGPRTRAEVAAALSAAEALAIAAEAEYARRFPSAPDAKPDPIPESAALRLFEPVPGRAEASAADNLRDFPGTLETARTALREAIAEGGGYFFGEAGTTEVASRRDRDGEGVGEPFYLSPASAIIVAAFELAEAGGASIFDYGEDTSVSAVVPSGPGAAALARAILGPPRE